MDCNTTINPHLIGDILEQHREAEGCIIQLVEAAVDEGLIQVQHEGELRGAACFEGEGRGTCSHLIRQGRQVLDEEVAEVGNDGF